MISLEARPKGGGVGRREVPVEVGFQGERHDQKAGGRLREIRRGLLADWAVPEPFESRGFRRLRIVGLLDHVVLR